MKIRLIMAMMLCCCMLRAATSDSLSVGLVTCYPGEDVYELEGHTALHIQGRYHGEPLDVAMNYGLYDFNAPNFVYRFVKGETDYWCGMSEWYDFITPYMLHGRRIVEHHIPMDSVQTQRFIELISQNMQPENRVYRYNYVKDNCATRPLRLLEMALGDSIILSEPDGPCREDHTFREIMERHHKNYPWYQFGIDLALGSGIDYPITVREKSFAPTVLCQQLDSAKLSSGRKLADEVNLIYLGSDDVTLAPTPWYETPVFVCWCLFAIVLFFTIRDIKRKRTTKWLDALLYLIYGLAGLVITFLVFISVHEATSPNWLILWLNPLCLIVPIFIWFKRFNKLLISYQIINFALVLLMIAIWIPMGQKGNAAFIPLIGCDLLRSISYIYVSWKCKTNRIK